MGHRLLLFIDRKLFWWEDITPKAMEASRVLDKHQQGASRAGRCVGKGHSLPSTPFSPTTPPRVFLRQVQGCLRSGQVNRPKEKRATASSPGVCSTFLCWIHGFPAWSWGWPRGTVVVGGVGGRRPGKVLSLPERKPTGLGLPAPSRAKR